MKTTEKQHKLTIQSVAFETGLSYQAVWYRVRNGQTLEEVLFEGPRCLLHKPRKDAVVHQISTGEQLSARELAEMLNIPCDTVNTRLNKGESADEILRTGPKTVGRPKGSKSLSPRLPSKATFPFGGSFMTAIEFAELVGLSACRVRVHIKKGRSLDEIFVNQKNRR